MLVVSVIAIALLLTFAVNVYGFLSTRSRHTELVELVKRIDTVLQIMIENCDDPTTEVKSKVVAALRKLAIETPRRRWNDF